MDTFTNSYLTAETAPACTCADGDCEWARPGFTCMDAGYYFRQALMIRGSATVTQRVIDENDVSTGRIESRQFWHGFELAADDLPLRVSSAIPANIATLVEPLIAELKDKMGEAPMGGPDTGDNINRLAILSTLSAATPGTPMVGFTFGWPIDLQVEAMTINNRWRREAMAAVDADDINWDALKFQDGDFD